VVDNIEDFRALDPFFRIIEEDWQDSPHGLSVLAASRAQMERSAGHVMRVIFVKISAARVLAAAGCGWQSARCRPDPARWPAVWGRIAAVTSARG
jgi:hypothetical protein